METTWDKMNGISKPLLIEEHLGLLRNLFHEVSTPVDNAGNIVQILETYGFDEFPEETKYYVLTCEKPNKESVWEAIIHQDKLNTMEVLLPLTPLFPVKKDSKQMKHKWIDSPEWAQRVLYDHKVRWTSETCTCEDHIHPCNEREKLCALKDIACSSFAAYLFCQGCKTNSITCTTFLFKQRPEILSVDVDYRKPLVWTIREENDILSVLLASKPPIHIIVNGLVWLAELDIPLEKSEKVAQCLVKGRENEITLYKSQEGLPIMHVWLCSTWPAYITHGKIGKEVRLLCAKLALQCGADPCVRACGKWAWFDDLEHNWTGMDILINIMLAQNCPQPFLADQGSIEESFNMLQCLVECAELILPCFKDKPEGQITLPRLNVSYTSLEALNMDYLKAAQVLLNRDLFDVDVENAFMHLIYNNLLDCEKQYPCVMCEPVVQLFYSAMCQGFDLNKAARHGTEEPVTLSEMLGIKLAVYYHGDKPTSKQMSRRGCCVWALFQMSIHFSTKITDKMIGPEIDGTDYVTAEVNSIQKQLSYDKRPKRERILHRPTGYMNMYSGHVEIRRNCLCTHYCKINLYNISETIKLIWLYHPTSKPLIVGYLDELYEDVSTDVKVDDTYNHDDSEEEDEDEEDTDQDDDSQEEDENEEDTDQDDEGDADENEDGVVGHMNNDIDAKAVVRELQELMLRVRPLTLLCRLTVLKCIQWKDINELHIPLPLRRYLQLGDISPTHVVYNVM